MKISDRMIDRTKIKYGRLQPLEPVSKYETYKSGNIRQVVSWICKCDCGKILTVPGTALTSKGTSSCGCSKDWIFDGFGDINQRYWNTIIRMAKRRGIDFSLSIEDAWNVFVKQRNKCALSGADIHFEKKYTPQYQSKQNASLDRIDSSKVYTIDNIQWVHKDINLLKGSFSDNEFIFWCKGITNQNLNIDSTYVYDNTYKLSSTYIKYNQIPTTYISHLIENAKRRKIYYDLDAQYLFDLLINQDYRCALTNVPIELVINYCKKYKYQTASVDRIDNSKGYIKGNMQWVHKKINNMRKDYSIEELKCWAQKVSDNND